jgi:hypothetical protein
MTGSPRGDQTAAYPLVAKRLLSRGHAQAMAGTSAAMQVTVLFDRPDTDTFSLPDAT